MGHKGFLPRFGFYPSPRGLKMRNSTHSATLRLFKAIQVPESKKSESPDQASSNRPLDKLTLPYGYLLDASVQEFFLTENSEFE